MKTDKSILLDKLADFVCQRPGLERGNYDTTANYNRELRSITKYLAPCLFLISKAHADTSLTAGHIAETAKRTFGGRLEWNDEAQTWEYTAGQYWPTEYRAAAWALLAYLETCYADHRKFRNL